MIKKIVLTCLLGILLFLGYHYESLLYGLQQARGQAVVLWKAKKINDLLESPSFPDSTKAKFRFIQEVKEFAQEEIGLAESKNYTTFYDQKGKPILWVVTASPEFKIKAYEWNFPIAGSFSYKGFFDLSKAKNEAKKLKEMGYDTEIDEVNAWSTLGWFRDPILSSMLNKKEGRLAELIIHELTHATIYIKNDIQFNENLATFIGRKGAKMFLNQPFKFNPEKAEEYQKVLEKKDVFKKWVWQSKQKLDSLYNNFPSSYTIEEKRKLKNKTLFACKAKLLNSRHYTDSLEATKRLQDFKPNNAFFSGISTYYSEQDKFDQQLQKEFNGNLKAFVASFVN